MNTRRRGALNIIGGLLIASALARLSVTGYALAESGVVEDLGVPAALSDRNQSDTTLKLLHALQEREARIALREAKLADRMQALQIAEDELDDQLRSLTEAEEALRATIALADQAASTDLERLTRVYENMKPKDAAALFETMPPAFASGFLGMMEPVAAAQIMTLMTPESAYSISAVLAGRNADVPTQ